MTKFKDIIFDENIVVHCRTNDQWNRLVDYLLHKNGNCSIRKIWFNRYSHRCCINAHKGNAYDTHALLEDYLNKDYSILSFKDAIDDVIKIKVITSPQRPIIKPSCVINNVRCYEGDTLCFAEDVSDGKICIIKAITEKEVICTDGKVFLIKDCDIKNRYQLTIKSHINYTLNNGRGKPVTLEVGDIVYSKSNIFGSSEYIVDELSNNKIRVHSKKHKAQHLTYDNITGKSLIGLYSILMEKPIYDFSESYDIKNINPKHKWIATDKNGNVYSYLIQPMIDEDSELWCTDDESGNRGIYHSLLNTNKVCIDWEYSLMEINKIK